jgi:hypothetical protein
VLLKDINIKVEEKVRQSNQKIIMGMYQNMIYAHNSFCGCNYCKVLNEYVLEKKNFSRYKKWSNGSDFLGSDMVPLRIELFKIKIEELKSLKDKLKKIE